MGSCFLTSFFWSTRMLTLLTLPFTRFLWYPSTKFLYTAYRMAAFYRIYLSRSRYSLRLVEFVTGFGGMVRVVWIVTSIGINASILYTRLKGVSLIGGRIVVWYDHSTCFSSSTQLPFGLKSLAFMAFTIVWFVTSTCSFAWGWATTVKFCLTPLYWHHFLNGLSINCLPFSLMITWSWPNQHIICFHMNLMILLHDMTKTSSASTHLVRLSITTLKNLTFPGASRNSSMIPL